MNRWTALLLGSLLASLPFLVYGLGGGHGHAPGPHMDHAPRHGGVLHMIGDYHLEYVERDGRVELYTSDAVRRPVTPTSGRMLHADGSATSLVWQRERLVAPLSPEADVLRYEVRLPDDVLLPLPAP